MAVIRPFRHAIVYPMLMRDIENAWRARDTSTSPASSPSSQA
jgi:hypothetical protein